MAVAVQQSQRRVFPYVLATLLIGTAAVLAWRGWSFYKLPLDQRPDHPDFRVLRSHERIGKAYGYAGAGLVVLNLSYLIRRHIASTKLGSMRVWLDIHVFTGLLAAVFICFHSAFQLRNVVAMWASIAFSVVVVTGLLGRFLYALSPTAGARRLGGAVAALDADVPGIGRAIDEVIADLPAPEVRANVWLLGALLAIPRWRKVSRRRRGAIKRIAAEHDVPRSSRKQLRAVLKAASADARASGAAALLRTWRSLHRFFAILMLVAVGVHVGVAWYYGYF